MVYETTYVEDDNAGVLYFETVDDASDISAAFMAGDNVIFHFPEGEAVRVGFYEAYMKLIYHQPGKPPYIPPSFVFSDCLIGSSAGSSTSALDGRFEVVDGKLRVYVYVEIKGDEE